MSAACDWQRGRPWARKFFACVGYLQHETRNVSACRKAPLDSRASTAAHIIRGWQRNLVPIVLHPYPTIFLVSVVDVAHGVVGCQHERHGHQEGVRALQALRYIHDPRTLPVPRLEILYL